ncbi:hypothetical protein Bca4012_072935 [Brassica carinata]
MQRCVVQVELALSGSDKVNMQNKTEKQRRFQVKDDLVVLRALKGSGGFKCRLFLSLMQAICLALLGVRLDILSRH